MKTIKNYKLKIINVIARTKSKAIPKSRFLAKFIPRIVGLGMTLGLIFHCLYAQTTKIQLDNGFTLVHCEKKKIGLVSVSLFVKGGAAIETDNEAGITNLTVQLLTKGTANRTSEKIAIESESLGATIFAGCSNDFSEVSMIVPSDNFVSAFDIFTDVVNNPTFPEKEFEKEKTRTIAAIKSKSDRIFDVAYDEFNEQIFKNHPYHKPVEGYKTTVFSLTASQISDNYRKHFKTTNMVLCVTGDVDFETTKKLVEKYFGNIKIIGTTEKTKKEQLKIELLKQSKKIYAGKFQQSYIFSGFLAPDINQKEYATLKVINAVLGGGMGSRLFDVLREKNGLVYEGDSFYPSRKEISDFVLYAGTSKENVGTVEKIFVDEIKKLTEITEDELKNAKEYLKGTYLLDHRTIQRQCWWLGFWETMGKGYEYDKQYLEDIDRVSITDIKTVCEKYFNPKEIITVILK
ncbi:MAG: insulinase family protein [Elusimicrobia bacterium]|nr:insulinase family protein [Elusimicrobiota bacterium]